MVDLSKHMIHSKQCDGTLQRHNQSFPALVPSPAQKSENKGTKENPATSQSECRTMSIRWERRVLSVERKKEGEKPRQ